MPLKAASATVDTGNVRIPALREQAGFSLIEVLASVLILVLGLLATFTLIDRANRTVSANNARTGGTNLARELIEYARGTEYSALSPDQLEPALRARPSVAGGTTSPWTLERRGVAYQVQASACTFDDPKDGLASTPPPSPCPAAAPVASAPASDINPDDFRRVTFTLRWRAHGQAGKATQTALVVNPAGGLGPRIERFDDVPGDVTTSTASWGAVPKPQLTSTPAAGIFWTVDDGQAGDAGGGPTSWTLDWNLGTDKRDPLVVDGSWVVDGTYTVRAQAKDDRGVPGETKTAVVHVNRSAPDAVTGFRGGYNARFGVVDLQWDRYPERDLLGYKVVRLDGTQVCPADGSAHTSATATSCTDFAPPVGVSTTYTLYALDRTLLHQPASTPRTGDPSVLKDVPLVPLVPPLPPAGLTGTVEDGLPKLDWNDPPDGARVAFYRIYRDRGIEFKDRYDQTITAQSGYADPRPGSTPHTYWVTAVDRNFNESLPSAPFRTPAAAP